MKIIHPHLAKPIRESAKICSENVILTSERKGRFLYHANPSKVYVILLADSRGLELSHCYSVYLISFTINTKFSKNSLSEIYHL